MAQPDDEPLDFDDEEEDEAPARLGRLYITRTGADRLRAELKALLHTERPKVTAEVTAAAAQGDRSENAEYIYGKKRLREIDRRLRFLTKRLEAVTVVDPLEQKDTGKIYFGATVTLENEEDGTRNTWQIVGPDEIDTRAGKISVESPVGRALLGKKLGEQVLVVRPRGEVELTVLAIVYR